MSRTLSWVGPMLLATTLVAQQGPTPDPKAAPPPAAERFAALQADQKAVIAEFQAKAKEARAKAESAKASGAPMPAMPMRPDFAPLVDKAMAAASDYAGTDDAVQFLVFVMRNAGGNKAQAASVLETLTEKHLDHAALAELGQTITYLQYVVGDEAAPRILDRLAKSANADVRGWTVVARNRKAIERAAFDSDAYKTAKAELQKAAELAQDKGLKGEIQEAIATREKLGAGTMAPDIEGTDLDGVAFKLSDYKGKVVFLDFWGDW